MGLTILIYLLQILTGFVMGGVDLPAALGMKVNALIQQGQLWRLFTPMLLHGSLLHIGFNMYALYALGPGLESFYGHRRFLLLYVLSGFAGNVFSFLFSPANSLGSSTAIFGLLGAQAVFLYQNKKLFGAGAQRALGNVILVAVLNLRIGLSPGIDNWGHLGGLIGGALFAWFAGPLMRVQTTYYGYELADTQPKQGVLWGILLSAGLFTAVVIGKFIAAL
jgi:rhomboid protease GluP